MMARRQAWSLAVLADCPFEDHPGEASADWITKLMGLVYVAPYGFLVSVPI